MSISSIKESGIKAGRILLYLVIIALAGLIIYKSFIRDKGDYTTIPTEMNINYIPSDFEFDSDPETILKILINPERNKKAFSDLIYNFNIGLLYHVANRMDLADSLKSQIELIYEKHHGYLLNLYYEDFISLRDSSSNLYETWYNNQSKSAVDVLYEVGSKYTCFLVNHVIMTLMKDLDGAIQVKGNRVATPCGIALTEALKPMIDRLRDRAAIDDFEASKGVLEEKIEEVIAELATYELRDKKGLTRQMQTKVFGYSVSTTDVEISAISILKVGFRLSSYFNVSLNSRNKAVTITLPEPEILSHEVYPKLDKLDIGWLREVTNTDLNKNFNLLRAEFRREALENNVMEKAKRQAEDLMKTFFSPVISTFDSQYTIEVKFQTSSETLDDADLLGENVNG